MYKIKKKEIEKFNKTGILVVRNFFRSKNINFLKKKVLNYKKKIPNKNIFSYYEKSLISKNKILIRVENFYNFDKTLKKIIDSRIIKENIKILFKTDPILFKEKINFKSPGCGPDRLHQDSQAGWWKYSKNFISIVIPVEKSTKLNSCLEFDISGNNCKKLLTKKMSALPLQKLKKPKFKKFELNIGDVVFFNSYAPHRSKSNFSNKGRSQIYLTYNKKKDGNFRKKYFREKRISFPPNSERLKNKKYVYQV